MPNLLRPFDPPKTFLRAFAACALAVFALAGRASALDLDAAASLATGIGAHLAADDSVATATSDAVDSLAMTPADSLPPSTPAAPPTPEKPSLVDRAKNGSLYFLSDLWWVVSSPARLNVRSAIATGAVLGIEAVLYNYDQDLYDATQRNKNEQPFKALMDFTDLYVPIGFMPNAFKIEAGVAVVGYAFKSDPLIQIPFECIESHLIAGGLRNTLGKPLVGRAHPSEGFGPRTFNGGTSFPSGHTSIFFEIATILSEHVHLAPVTAGLYALATLGAVQRVESSNHWPSDVFFPAVTGTVIARTIVRRNAERREKAGMSSVEPPSTGWTPLLAAGPDGLRFGIVRGF